MKLFISSTPTELTTSAELAVDVAEATGWKILDRGLAAARSVDEGLAAIERADLMLALVGWRRGPMPQPMPGWDGQTPWLIYEVRRAFALRKPVLVLQAGEDWSERESAPRARAQMADFRAELEALALPLDRETDDGESPFRKRLEEEFARLARRNADEATASTRSIRASELSKRAKVSLRRWSPPSPPPEPWPLLLPYSHLGLLAGRDRDLEQLLARLDRPQPILGLHAASGTGKSSLIAGGLVPTLRARGRAVALDRRPAEPGLAARLIGDLLTGPSDGSLDDGLLASDEDPQTFIDLLKVAGRRAGSPPILVLDQVEDVLNSDRQARAVLGLLLAATVQRQPDAEGPPCRWLLAYRREYHGEFVRWLADGLREARALGLAAASRLPFELSSHERFHDWPLPVVGAIQGRGANPRQSFLDILTRPLQLQGDDGRPLYGWRFADDGAERLAEAFAAARRADPEAPLVPQLQVVLAHLMVQAKRPTATEPALLIVPEHPEELIDDALAQHLARALDSAFPPDDQVGRTRALLALYELTDQGRRGAARAGDEVARAAGKQGREILEALQAPGARLVVAARRGDETVYSLSHDRLAEVVTAAVEGQGQLALDPELLALRRFVSLSTELFHSGDSATSTRVSKTQRAGIEAHADSLLAGQRRKDWWTACGVRRRRDRRRRLTLASWITIFAAFGVWLFGSQYAARANRMALLDLIVQGDPEAAFAALGEALEDDRIQAGTVFARLQERSTPLDVLESGMGGLPEPQRSRLALRVAELAMPLVRTGGPQDPAALASWLWALDYSPMRRAELADRALELRDAALASLRKNRPPPGIADDDPDWVSVPAGNFRMGTEADEEGKEDQRPARDVKVSAFRILRHEVTYAEYRRLDPSRKGPDEMPVGNISWYRSYLYAAWLGGPGIAARLPTEAEWEYAARAGCAFQLCLADGSEATIDDVAWTSRTARDPVTWVLQPQAGRQLAPNPWGLYDVFGNLLEWTADWYTPYDAGAQVDPWGSTGGPKRSGRGGNLRWQIRDFRPAQRIGIAPSNELAMQGLRPVLPMVSEPRADGQ